MVRNFPVRPWSSQGDTFSPVTLNEVTTFNWFIAACFLTAMLYGFFNGESVGAWSPFLIVLAFSLGAFFRGDVEKPLINNHEY